MVVEREESVVIALGDEDEQEVQVADATIRLPLPAAATLRVADESATRRAAEQGRAERSEIAEEVEKAVELEATVVLPRPAAEAAGEARERAGEEELLARVGRAGSEVEQEAVEAMRALKGAVVYHKVETSSAAWSLLVRAYLSGGNWSEVFHNPEFSDFAEKVYKDAESLLAEHGAEFKPERGDKVAEIRALLEGPLRDVLAAAVQDMEKRMRGLREGRVTEAELVGLYKHAVRLAAAAVAAAAWRMRTGEHAVNAVNAVPELRDLVNRARAEKPREAAAVPA